MDYLTPVLWLIHAITPEMPMIAPSHYLGVLFNLVIGWTMLGMGIWLIVWGVWHELR